MIILTLIHSIQFIMFAWISANLKFELKNTNYAMFFLIHCALIVIKVFYPDFILIDELIVYTNMILCFIIFRTFYKKIKIDNRFRNYYSLKNFEILKNYQKICIFCFDTLDKKSVCGYYCEHLYHRECIIKWVIKKKSCPICKKYI